MACPQYTGAVSRAEHRRRPARAIRRRRAALVGVGVLLAAALIVGGIWWSSASTTNTAGRMPTASVGPTPSRAPTAPPPAPPADKPKSFFDRGTHSIDDPNSIWIVSNKTRPLHPLDWAPADLIQAAVPGNAPIRAEAAAAMEAMFAAASAEAGVSLAVQNAYRSYSTQVSVHSRLVGQLGKDLARAQSAMPGYSEHQTGLTADIMAANGVCTIQECFATTPEGTWLAENAWRFGYHLRYPQGKTDVTGYIFEPWHYRYIGPELAAELHRTGTLTLEEFFGLPAAPDYPPGV